jgi:hypothetical protein
MLQSYNLDVTASAHFRTLSLWLISLLMGLLALGPFLHAHYGGSAATGFHVNGLQAVVIAHASGLSADSPMLSSPTEQESPAAGVVTSLPRSEADSLASEMPPVVILSLIVLSLLPALRSAWPWNPAAPAVITRLFQAGCPPPAHAPPLSH